MYWRNVRSGSSRIVTFGWVVAGLAASNLFLLSDSQYWLQDVINGVIIAAIAIQWVAVIRTYLHSR